MQQYIPIGIAMDDEKGRLLAGDVVDRIGPRFWVLLDRTADQLRSRRVGRVEAQPAGIVRVRLQKVNGGGRKDPYRAVSA